VVAVENSCPKRLHKFLLWIISDAGISLLITRPNVGGHCFDIRMSISGHHHTDGPAARLSAVRAEVADLAETFWPAQPDEAVVDVVDQVQRARAALAAVEAHAVAEAEARDLARRRLHFGSTGDWLTHVGGLRRGEGKHLVRRAVALTGPLTRTREAMVAGTVSPEQADVIVRAVSDLPGAAHVRRRAEQTLVRYAGRFDATDLARTGRHLLSVIDPDGEDRTLEAQLDREERAAHADRYLSITDDGAGGIRLKGRGSVEDGALIKAALLPLTCPTPAVDEHDGSCPLQDPRDGGARMWDAAVQVFQHALDTQVAPDSHGTPARLLVTISHEALLDGLGTGLTANGLEVPPQLVRRLACDAEVVPVVLGSRGEVLDVGRSSRTVTTGIWHALVARDRHCAFPACTRPPVMCHAHHIRHWADGGSTALHNLVLVCGHHHRVLHHTPWQIRLNPDDRQPEFSPPPRHGQPRRWIRHRPRSDN
jgi:hypothetical protein